MIEDELKTKKEIGEDVFRNYLLPNEHIIWAGKPDLSIKFTETDIFLIPFGLFWFLAMLGFMCAAFGLLHEIKSEGIIVILPAFMSLIFVFMGYYLLFGRFIYKRRKNSNTFYALSNIRVLILIKETLTTINLNTLKNIEIYRKKNNIGSIILGSSVISKKLPFNQKYYGNTGLDFLADNFFNPGYFVLNDIDNVEDVMKLIESTSGIHCKD